MKSYTDIARRIGALAWAAVAGSVRACLRVFCVMKWHPFRRDMPGALAACRVCGQFVSEKKK